MAAASKSGAKAKGKARPSDGHKKKGRGSHQHDQEKDKPVAQQGDALYTDSQMEMRALLGSAGGGSGMADESQLAGQESAGAGLNTQEVYQQGLNNAHADNSGAQQQLAGGDSTLGPGKKAEVSNQLQQVLGDSTQQQVGATLSAKGESVVDAAADESQSLLGGGAGVKHAGPEQLSDGTITPVDSELKTAVFGVF